MHIVTGDLKNIADFRIRSIICKGPKHIFPSSIDFTKCRQETAGVLQEFVIAVANVCMFNLML